MAVDIPALREIVERVCTRNDVLNACKRRDIGTLITALCKASPKASSPSSRAYRKDG